MSRRSVGPDDRSGPQWMAWANCRGTDTEAFYPDHGGSTDVAKRVCARCLVDVECLEYALDNDERFGVWGGLSERQRLALKRHKY